MKNNMHRPSSAATAVAVGIIGIALLSEPGSAEANCGDFGVIGVAVTGLGAVSGAVIGGFATPGILRALRPEKDYPYWPNAGLSLGIGVASALAYIPIDLGTGCNIANLDGKGGGPFVIGATTLALSAGVALIAWAVADRIEAPVAIVPASIGNGGLLVAARW